MFQKECIHRLQNRIEVQYDSANKEHRVLRFLLTLNCPYEVHLSVSCEILCSITKWVRAIFQKFSNQNIQHKIMNMGYSV